MQSLHIAVLGSYRMRIAAALLLAVLGCDARFAPAQANGAPDSLGAQEGTRHVLPGPLAEISGLAVDGDRVFAHDDEIGRIYQIDPRTGRILETFSLGRPRATGDFEGIARANDRFFLVTSEGRLVEFEEGADGERVEYQVHETQLRRRCEIEGLDYDARTESLLLACKTPHEKELRDRLVVFEYSLRRQALEPAPRLSLSLDFLEAADHKPELHPSGIALHPRTGRIFVLAARERLLVELDGAGVAHGVRELSRRHPQAEGIAFLADGTLLIADERAGGGLLTLYPPSASITGEEGSREP